MSIEEEERFVDARVLQEFQLSRMAVMPGIVVSQLYTSNQLSETLDVEVITGNGFGDVSVRTFFMITARLDAENGSSPDSLIVSARRNYVQLSQ
jgi:hypothetical protein